MPRNKTTMDASAIRRPCVASATLLVSLALYLAATTAADACACCSEPGMRSDQTTDISDYEKDELSQLRFGSEARLYAGPGFPDDLEGIENPDDAPYQLGVAWAQNAWTFEFTDSTGKTGLITFARPQQVTMFEVDSRMSDARSQGGGPLLYKEWRLNGPVKLSGIFTGSNATPEATLILQGKGNSCTSAGDFFRWTLQVAGEEVDFAFLGFFTGGPSAETQTAPSATDAVIAETFSCEDGTVFDASFDNSGPYSLAILKLKDQAETPLIQAPSGSGVIYSNGDYTLHTKADSAVLMRNDKTWLCKAK